MSEKQLVSALMLTAPWKAFKLPHPKPIAAWKWLWFRMSEYQGSQQPKEVTVHGHFDPGGWIESFHGQQDAQRQMRTVDTNAEEVSPTLPQK